MTDLSNLTIAALDAMEREFPVAPPRQMLIIPSTFEIPITVQRALESYAIPVFRTEYLSTYEPAWIPRRRDHRTRRGYKVARNHALKRNRRAQRQMTQTGYLLVEKMNDYSERLFADMFGMI